MKLLGYLLIFGFIGFSSCQYTAIGVRKSEAYIKKLFIDTFNYTFPLIHYIEFYDISVPFNKAILDSTLTLSEIRLSNLKFDTGKLAFNVTPQDHSLVISNGKKAVNLEVTADLEARWTYKFGPIETQDGTFNAKLKASQTNFTFEFAEDYSKSKSMMNNVWEITKSEIKGFGAYDKIREAINEMVKKQLSSKIDEEIGKYGVLLLNLMTYGKIFRRIKVKGQITNSNPFIIMSEVTGMLNPKGKAPFNVKYESIIMDEMTHKKAVLNSVFDGEKDMQGDVSLHVGLGAAKTIFNHYISTSFESFLIDESKQVEIFKQKLTIRSLLPFYPRLAERFDPAKNVDLSCSILSAGLDKINYTCAFFLASPNNVVALLIDELQWDNLQELSFDDTEKAIVIKNAVKSFSSIVIKNVHIEEYAARQLMFFLKPLSDYLANISVVKIMPETKQENLNYVGSHYHAGESIEVWYKANE